MNVSAYFFPNETMVGAGETATLTLQLQNTTDAEQVATLTVLGDLAAQTVLQSEKVHLAPQERFDVPVLVDPSTGMPAGQHECRVEVMAGDHTVSAVATVDVASHTAFAARLDPPRSRSSRNGRHKIAIENTGNTPILIDLTARSDDDQVEIELAAPSVSVEAGTTSNVEIRAVPFNRYWNGDPQIHPFELELGDGLGGSQHLEGEYEQTPRVKPWFGPALAGMLGALLIWLLLWFLWLRPAVESIAQDEAAELDALQQSELDAQVEEIRLAAEEASELPLGEPTDLRLSISAAPGTDATDAFDFDRSGTGRTLSISDIIFQNPTGAVGTVEFLRDGEILLQQEMANFRDLDFHLVAPFRVNSGSSIGLRVACATPGPGTADCQVAATIIGFVDDE